ncbi:EamA family transporter [Sulfobacillus thermotolerans]|uniref:EamA family transporter n=1 Tax=Sulfobacillus thermotolerans TaxID=338644 RepID=A0ABM6RPE9_9FIRM|nr:EamA family transporter [Sulfobacillus thermotolerans]
MRTQRFWGGVFLAIAASIWGGMYVVSKVVLEVIPPLSLMWIRYVLAVIALVSLGLLRRESWRLPRQYWGLVAAIGVIGYIVSIWAQFLGTALSTAQMGSVITAATPAFMVVFAHVLLRERITRQGLGSVLLAMAGVWLIVGWSARGPHSITGGVVLFVAAVTWALMSVLIKKVPSSVSLLVVTVYALAIAFLLLSPMAWLQLHHVSVSQLQPFKIWGGLLYLGVISTAVAFFLWNEGLKRVDAATGGIYFFFQPVAGSLLGWLLLGEQVSAAFWLGAALIAGGVMFAIRTA